MSGAAAEQKRNRQWMFGNYSDDFAKCVFGKKGALGD